MILCHKCSGVLANADSEDVSGLSGCGCISGYVRGFEPNVQREVAIRSQVTRCFERVDSYTRQGREQDWIDPLYVKADTLMNLL